MGECYKNNLEDPVVALWGNLHFSLRSLNEYAKQSHVKSFVKLAARLDDTINHIRFMVIIPETLLIHQQMNLHFLSHHLWAALKTETVKSNHLLTVKEREAYEAALNESVTKGKERVESKKTLEEWINKATEQKHKVIELYQMVEPYNSLLYSGLVWTWTAFEVFAADLWEACINLSTGKVRSKIIKSFGTVKPVIKIDYIAKYNYDIRGRLGTMMKDSFNFTSLEGIRKAYKVIFPKSQGVLDALGRSELVELEASRHLVVHCCGIADDEFCRKSGLNLKIGDKLPITDKLVFDYLSLITDVSLVLLRTSESLVGSRSRQGLPNNVIKEQENIKGEK